jgi:tubulin-folding cofactor B
MTTLGPDALALREWVTGGGPEVIGEAPPGHVRLEIRHSVLGGFGAGATMNMFTNVDLKATVFEVKEILHLRVGTSPEHMRVILQDREGNVKGKLLEDSLQLGYFSPQNGWVLFVEDRDPMKTVANYQNIANLKEEDRFKYTDEQYDKRPGTLRQFLKENPAAAAKVRQQAGKREPEDGKELAEAMKVGNRCQVRLESGALERGEIKYIGKLHEREGYFIGVQFDLPVGKNDGSVRGQRYFQCPERYGLFVFPNDVEVGDFPEEDLFGSDEEGK